jgi:hypothetical protein
LVEAATGLWLFVGGIQSLAQEVFLVLGLFEARHTTAKFYAASGATQLVIGAVLFRGFLGLANVVCPSATPTEEEAASNQQSK